MSPEEAGAPELRCVCLGQWEGREEVGCLLLYSSGSKAEGVWPAEFRRVSPPVSQELDRVLGVTPPGGAH